MNDERAKSETTNGNDGTEPRISADMLSRNNFLEGMLDQMYIHKYSGSEVIGISYDDFERLLEISIDDQEKTQLLEELDAKEAQINGLRAQMEDDGNRFKILESKHLKLLSKVGDTATGQVVGFRRQDLVK